MLKIRSSVTIALGLLAAIVVMSCRDQFGPHESRTANLSFAPVFKSARAGLVPVTAARIVATLQSTGTVVTDSVFDIAGQDSIDVGLVVPIVDPNDIFLITLALVGLQNDTVFRGGPIEIPANSANQPAITPLELEYTGVGASADSVVVVGSAPTLFTGSSFTFQAVAFNADTIVPGTPVAWSTPDSAQAAVPDYTVGRVVGAGTRGNARIVAELLSGGADTATVLIQPNPASASVPAGNSQSGEVAAQLPGPITVQILGDDGLGVRDAVVRFSGVGAFSPDTAVTDVDGTVQTLWTLGTVAGPQVAMATVDDVPAGVVRTRIGLPDAANVLDHVSVDIGATGLAGSPTQLGFAIQPVDTTAGSPVPVAVAVLDSLGNVVLPDTDRAIMLSIVSGTGTAGAALLGTNPGLTSGGVATFADITPDSLGTGYQLEATAASLFPDTSLSFTVRAGVLSSIMVAPPSATLDALAATTTFVATGLDTFGNVVTGLTFTWSSTDSSVAIPDAVGNVTAIGNGSATITASSGGLNGNASITVQQLAATVVVSPGLDTISVLAGTTQFTATVRDANGNLVPGPAIGWSLGDSSVASIDAQGLATALNNGSTSVIATVDGASGAATLVVDLFGASGVHWTNPAGGSWSEPDNWSTGIVPTASDTVYIDMPGTYTVNLDANATAGFLNMGATGAQTLSITSSALTVNTGGVWAPNTTLDMTGGSLNGTGGIVTNGTINWSGGEFGSTGNGTLLVNDGGVLNITGASKTLRAFTLALDGTGIWSGGTIQTGSGGALVIGTNGVLDVQGDLTFTYNLGGTPSRLDNAGIVRRTSGTGITQIGVQFNNLGTLESQVGELHLTQGGTSSGAFSVSSGAILAFGGGTHTLGPLSAVNGAGEVRFSGGTATIGGAYSISHLTNVTGGAAEFSSGVTSTTTDLIVSGGSVRGTGILSVSGTLSWTGGEFGESGAGTTRLEAGGTYAIGGGTKTHRGYTLALFGSGTWTAGIIQSGSGAVFSVESGGALDIQGDVTMTYSLGGGVPRFDNAGTVSRTVGVGTVALNVPFNNLTASSAVDVQTGVLTVSQNSTWNGSISLSSGAFFDFLTGAHDLASGFTVTGPAPARITGGTISIPGSSLASFDELTVTGGSLTGAGIIDVVNTFIWSGGNLEDATNGGIIRIGPSAVASFEGGTKTLRRIFQSPGTVTWTAGTIQTGSAAVFDNQGSFEIQGDLAFTYSLGGVAPQFNNAGTVLRSVGTGTASLNVPFNNLTPSSTLDVQTGTLSVSQNSTWDGTVTVVSGTSFDIVTGLHALNDGFSVTGPAPTQILGGTVSIGGDLTATFDELTMAGGTLTGAGTVEVVTALDWTGGNMDDADNGGTTLLGSGATAAFTTGTKTLRRVFENDGVIVWSGGTIQTGAGGILENRGTFEIQGDLTYTYILGGTQPSINNTGILTRTVGSGTTSLNVNVANLTGGILDIQIGTLTLTQAYADVTGSAIQGNGVLNLTGASFGTIAADIGPGTSPGVLGMVGNYVQDGAASLNIEIGGPSAGSGAGFHDQLNVSGIANLAGALDITVSGGYTPVLGDLYTVATFSSATGGFGTGISLPLLGGTMSLDARFTPVSTEIGVRQTVNMDILPAHLAVNTGTDTIYAVQASSNQMVVFDVSTGSVAGQVPVSNALNLSHIDINETRNKLYIVEGVEIGVYVVDGATRQVLTQHTVGVGAQRLAWHRGTDSVYVTALVPGVSGPGIYVLDGTSPFDSVYNQSTRLIGAPPSGAGFITVDEVNDRIFAGIDNGFVVRLQASTKEIADSVVVGSAPRGIAVNRSTRRVYVVDETDNSLTVIDDTQPAGSAVVAVIPSVGARPTHVEVDEGTNMIFVGGQAGVTVIDGNTNTVKTMIPNAPTSDNQVAFHPGRGLLYFTNTAGQTITGTRP